MATERRQPAPERAAPERATPIVSQDAVEVLAQRQQAEAQARAEAEAKEAEGEQPLDEIHFDQGQGYLVNDVLVDANGNPIEKDAEPRTEPAER